MARALQMVNLMIDFEVKMSFSNIEFQNRANTLKT